MPGIKIKDNEDPVGFFTWNIQRGEFVEIEDQVRNTESISITGRIVIKLLRSR